MLHTQVPATLFPAFAFSPTVLVVDESADTYCLICEAISAAGYVAISAKNGNEALECMKAVAPDIILLDATSSLVDGFELARRIKSTSAWANIPILFMVERANTRQIINSYENGGIDYLSKPLCIPEVLARLLTCVTARIHTGHASA